MLCKAASRGSVPYAGGAFVGRQGLTKPGGKGMAAD
jgi:hypothetical protein